MSSAVPDVSLRNVGPGPDPFSFDALPDGLGFVVLFLQRDHHCTNCRRQVQQVADRVAAFRDRGAEVVSVVPEPLERVRTWQESYDLPYPLLADPDAELGDALDQPVRFGVLGDYSDFLGRMPAVAVVDLRGEDPELESVRRGRSTFDRPALDDLLAELDALRGDGA